MRPVPVKPGERPSRWRRLASRIPRPVAYALAIALVPASGFLLAPLFGPAPDLHAECRKQCEPRWSRVVPDKDYPMSRGKYREVCQCY